MINKFFIILIKVYRVLLSPFFGNCCRFHPSCSRYAEEAFKRYSFTEAVILTVKRFFRCHPLNPGGYDPLP